MEQKKWTAYAKNIKKEAEKASKELGHGYIGTEHILLGCTKVKDSIPWRILSHWNVSKQKIIDMIEEYCYPKQEDELDLKRDFTPQAEHCFIQAVELSDYFGADEVGSEHIFLSLLKDKEYTSAKLLVALDCELHRLFVDTLMAMGQDSSLAKEFFRKEKKNGMHESMLEQFGRDLTKLARMDLLDPVIGREQEISRVIQTLSRRLKNNPCVIGEPGVGKTAIIEGLARAIVEERVPKTLVNKRVIMLDLAAMIAGTKYRGEFEERFHNLMNEIMQVGNVLLFIDEIHTIIGTGNAEGSMDAANILKPMLARGELQVIGATTEAEFRKYFEKDAALERRFQSIRVEEPSAEQAIAILNGLKSRYEKHHGVVITEEAICEAVSLSARYITERCLPDKAIDLMDEAASKVRMQDVLPKDKTVEIEKKIALMEKEKKSALLEGDVARVAELRSSQDMLKKKIERLQKRQKKDLNVTEVTKEAIAEIVSEWTKIPVSQLQETESERLRKLEEILHQRVIGQDLAINAVSKAVRRGRVGMKDPKRPIGSFLFLGPTGVGKTELSKALAEAVFGTEKAMIRVDMSEYMEKHSVSKLIGSPPGYVGFDEGGQFSEKVRRQPYSLILFDEIEKAHPDVFHILLQVLDDGHITDSTGRKVDFKNTIIIMTSNAGASRIMSPKTLGFGAVADEKADYNRMKSNVMEEIKRVFRPEFLNRIDDILVFHALSKEEMKQIVTGLAKDIAKRFLQQTGAILTMTDEAKLLIVEESFDANYGARPLKRALQTKLEDQLVDMILAGEVEAGGEVIVSVEEKKLKFTSKLD